MKVLIMRAMRGEYPSMDVYADGLAAGLRQAFPEWTVEEVEPRNLPNTHLQSRPARALNGVKRYLDRFLAYPIRTLARDADIIHVMSDHYFHVARFPRLRGQKVVATCHDLIYYRFPQNIRQFATFLQISRAAQEFCMRSLRSCDHVITLSQDNVRDLEAILGVKPDKVSVIHNAVPAHFHPGAATDKAAARQKLDLPSDKFCIMHVGTVEPRKNVDTILKALVTLKDENVVFVKAGIAFTPAQQAFIAEHHLAGAIRHLGKVPNMEMVAVYHASDALIFPSLYEGFPFPIGEAMASGVPVITSTASSLPEVAGGAALLVDPLEVDQVVAAVRSLAADPALRDDLVHRGRERVSRLNWVENARQVGAEYERIPGK
ncbi:MAG: glycosyltransferase family 4 protein [Terrimicrobiaceae bacterium]